MSVRFGKRRDASTSDSASQELEGQVVRSTRSGVAIEWLEFAPERVRALIFIPAFESLWAAGSTLPGSSGGASAAENRQR